MVKAFNHSLNQTKTSNRGRVNKIKSLRDKEKFNKVISLKKAQ